MAKRAKNIYSTEADDFGLSGNDPFSGGMGGGMDMGMGGSFGGGFGSSNTTVSNGLKPQDNIAVRGMKRLRKLLGISFPKDLPKSAGEKRINLFAYSPNEMKYQPGFADPSSDNNYPNMGGASSLYEYLGNTVQNSASWEREARSSNILSPEIEAAKDVMVASIMSPVDLQTDHVNIVVDNSDLSKEMEEKLSSTLTDYFNNDVHLGKRMTKWIGKALYQNGAVPVLILPQSNIYTMNKIIDKDELEAGRDPNDLISDIRPTKRPMDKRVASGESLGAKFEGYGSFEGLNIGKANSKTYDDFLSTFTDDAIASLEKLEFISNKHKDHIITNRGKFKEELKDVLENGKNWVRFSTDPSVISKHNSELKDRIAAMQQDIDRHLVFGKTDPAYVLDTGTSEKNTDTEAASIIELPYQAVIPIIVPGAPDKHIGYFVAVNQWGEPICPDTRDASTLNSNSRLMEANMQANFGAPSTLLYNRDMTNMQRFKATSAIFGIMLRSFMQQKLEEYGLGGTQVEQHEAITACLFRNLLDKKRIGLIFVPEPMMIYYHYDVHDDGTGKSLIEDIRTITGLRTTLVTAGIMAATENSIDQKIIELNVDEKNANVQQMLEQVKNAFIEKRIMRYDNNPINVQRDLVQKSLTLVPKGIKGLQDSINVNTEHKSQGSIMPDDNLLKQLTDWTIQALKCPQAAISKTGEDEYARSVVTTNLFFNNRVKILQNDTNEFTTKLIRTYIKYNTILKDQIKEVLNSTSTDSDEYSNEAQELSADQKEKEQKKAEKLRKTDTHPHKSDTTVETNTKSVNQNLLDVIDHIKCKLPEPRIVIDKAQYEEITGYADCIKRVCDEIYSDELLPDSMQQYSGTLRVLRARVKEHLVREFIKNVGFRSTFDMPALQDLELDDSEELSLLLINQQRGLDNIKEQVGDKVNMTGQDTNDSGMGMSSMGGGFGGDMTGGMGGSNMGGGFSDMGGTDIGADMNMGTTSEANTAGGESPNEETNQIPGDIQ